jgi:alpha-mannosidase
LQREHNLQGLAPVRQAPIAEFFRRLEQEKGNFQTWKGELYLGMHRATYTTQGRSKRYNRKIEIGLRELEFASALATLLAPNVPATEPITAIWQEVLLYQFHDILPGSSITRVYDESLARYATLSREVRSLTENAISSISGNVAGAAFDDPIMILNSLSWPRQTWLALDARWYFVTVPAMGYTTISGTEETHYPEVLKAKPDLLENDYLQVRFDDAGNVISVFDKEHSRPVLAAGSVANQLTVYQDEGDAWDFSKDYAYREVGAFQLTSCEFSGNGPVAMLTQTRHFGGSTLIQKIVLTAGSRRLDFITEVDWQERQKMLRTAFPVDIHADASTSEIQFGHVKRPNHGNTAWDRSRFEICAHKWCDISQHDYGVALLNDCKYGHRVYDNVLDINLLRSPDYPDPHADQGRHAFTYALYPHRGNHLDGGVIRAGYELNVPLVHDRIKSGDSGRLPASYAFLELDVKNVIVESVKRAEDNDDIIIRLYDAYGVRSAARLTFGVPVRAAFLTNLLEENVAELPVTKNSVQLDVKPFEIHTIRVVAEQSRFGK